MKLNILKKSKWIIVIVVVAVLGLVFSNLSRTKKVEAVQEIKNVKIVKASMASLVTEVEYASKLKAVQEITVSPKMPGKVASVGAEVGTYVEKGQVLFTLDSSEIQAQLSQQQAGLAAASANFEKTRDSSLEQQILQAEQGVEKAKINYNDAKDSYDRTKELFDSGVSTKVELDSATSRLNNASLDLKNAQDNLNILKAKSGPQSVKAASAQVQQAQAGVNYVKQQLNGMTVTSPISGVVTERNVEIGELASSGIGSFTIMDTKVLIAEVNIPDKMLSKVKVGQTVPVKVNALSNKIVSGVIDSISPAADSKTLTYIVKVKIDNANGELKPGMFTRVVLPAEKKDNILTVPNETIRTESGIAYVYAVDNKKVKKIVVKTGLSNDKITEITSNLKQGDEIITEGQIFLNEGEIVNVVQ